MKSQSQQKRKNLGKLHQELLEMPALLLSRRRDQILGVAEVDLEALAILTADYEAAHMPYIAMDLRKRLEHYRKSEILEGC